MRIVRPIGWVVLGMALAVVTGRAVGTVSARQSPYKVIQMPTRASDLEGMLNSNASVGWKLRAMDGGFVVFER